MKVASDHLHQIFGAVQNRPQNPAGNSGTDDFSKVLEKTGQSTGEPASGQVQPAATAALAPSGLVGMIMAGQMTADKNSPADQQIQSALDQMEVYAQALSDESKSLKEISPMADNLKQAAHQLNELSQSLAEGHPLKGLSREAAVLATVESMKFNRGDYI